MTRQHKKSLLKRGIIMFSLIPVILTAWAGIGYTNQWDIVETAMNSAVSTMFILAVFIISPLFMNYPSEECKKGYIFYWFTASTIFNFVWQIPLILFRSFITAAEVSYGSLFKYIAWWGYGFADSHYGRVDNWMISEEIWWFLAIFIAASGVLAVKRGRETRGFLLMGVGFLLQAYNASLYIVYDTVTGFQNIPLAKWQSWVLYWGFNPLWTICSLMAGIFSLQIVLKNREAEK